MERIFDNGLARIRNIVLSECDNQDLLNKWTEELKYFDNYDNEHSEKNDTPKTRNNMKWLKLCSITDKLIPHPFRGMNYEYSWQEKIINLLFNQNESDWLKEKASILRTRSPSDCDEDAFSGLPSCDEPGKLQLIHPDNIIVDNKFSQYIDTKDIPSIPSLKRQSNHPPYFHFNDDALDFIPEPKWHPAFEQSYKVDLSNFEIKK